MFKKVFHNFSMTSNDSFMKSYDDDHVDEDDNEKMMIMMMMNDDDK